MTSIHILRSSGVALRRGLLSVTVAVALTACSGSGDKPAADNAAPPATNPPAAQPMATTPPPASGDTLSTASGLRYVITKHGTGPQAKPGDHVFVHYVGTLTNGNKFDSSRDSGKPFDFILGQHQVIPGWDEGIALLHVGDRAMFTIPPNLGYGAAGMPPVIPPNSTLIFDVELMAINK